MKTNIAFASLVLALMAGTAAAQQAPNNTVALRDKTQPSPRLNPVTARAERLSSHMVRDLHLNNYQATKLRSINADKVTKMAAIEQLHAGNQKLIDEQCNDVCRERDREFQAFLSNEQYSNYFRSRAAYNKFDKDYASQSASIILANSVQNPAPARANDATIAPAKPKPASQPAGNLGRNAR